MLSSNEISAMLNSLAAYPRWFVVGSLTIVTAALIWSLAKILKWSLYLLLAVVVIVGFATTIWLVFH
ncbi:MAG: hypothetical protein NVV63_18565 [Opitutus sp.]|nr:hypothetical protein [Opitutus sp.]